MAGSETQRSFYAHDRGAHRQSGCLIRDAASFHDAAIAFAEQQAPEAEGGEISVIVKDCGTGEEQCFAVHLDDGRAEPC